MPIPRSEAPQRILLRDQVQEQIRAAIVNGTLHAGERLHDDELMGWLQVSRTPIREALFALAKEGLIEMAPNRYTRVVKPTSDDARNAVRALGILIASIIRITLPSMTVQQRGQIIKRVDHHIGELKTGGTEAIVRTVHEAYDAWLKLCPNPALAEVVRQGARGLAFAYRVDNIDQIIPAEPLIARLLAYRGAIAIGDAETAAQTMEVAHTPSTADEVE